MSNLSSSLEKYKDSPVSAVSISAIPDCGLQTALNSAISQFSAVLKWKNYKISRKFEKNPLDSLFFIKLSGKCWKTSFWLEKNRTIFWFEKTLLVIRNQV